MYDAASAGTVQGGGPEPLSPSVAVGLELVTEPGSALSQSGCAHKYTQIIIYILSVYISEMIFAREPHFLRMCIGVVATNESPMSSLSASLTASRHASPLDFWLKVSSARVYYII